MRDFGLEIGAGILRQGTEDQARIHLTAGWVEVRCAMFPGDPVGRSPGSPLIALAHDAQPRPALRQHVIADPAAAQIAVVRRGPQPVAPGLHQAEFASPLVIALVAVFPRRQADPGMGIDRFAPRSGVGVDAASQREITLDFPADDILALAEERERIGAGLPHAAPRLGFARNRQAPSLHRRAGNRDRPHSESSVWSWS